MDAALLTITMDVAVGFGLFFFYSSAADAETMAVAVDSVDLVTWAVATMETAVVNGLLSFLSSSAAAETMVPAANFSQASFSAAPSYIDYII